jgi:nicotinate-nucleotide adenylyltransferase
MKLGVLGGSFNPIHKCHLSIAHATRSVLKFDRVLFIPTGDPPHKPPGSFAAARHRYRMVQLAIEDEPAFSVTDLELRRPGKSYTIDTVRALQREQPPGTELYFIVGLDAFLDVPSWKESETLLRLCHFVVVSRPAVTFEALADLQLAQPWPLPVLRAMDSGQRDREDLPLSADTQLILLRLPPCDVSASEIRMRLRQKASLANLLPAPVESYILTKGLYAEDADRT